MLIYIYLSVFLVLSGLIVFSSKRKHLLIILLRLEFIVVSLYFNLIIYLSELNYEYFFSIIFLTIRVCEGVLGLSVLVSIIRTHGNDYIIRFSFLW